MDARERDYFEPLPGSDALKSAPLFNPNSPLPIKKARHYLKNGGHRNYLRNDSYNKYVRMHKVIAEESGADGLIEIADNLNQEVMPTYLDAAGWAYAEAGLVSKSASTVERIELVSQAEAAWQKSLVNSINFQSEFKDRKHRYEEDEGHRTALNLAFAPLLKSIIVGNVQPVVMNRALRDTAEIARDSRLTLDRAYKEGDRSAAASHRGFLYEASALMALLYMEDSRYVPLPATARGDTGYFHREQTHDISVINQHWGDIRKVVPIEIKSKASVRDKNRYKALIIPGKVRLTAKNTDPRYTADAFYDVVHGTASAKQQTEIDALAAQLREMLRLYQQGISVEKLAVNSLTRFYDTRLVAMQYPELSKEARRPHSAR